MRPAGRFVAAVLTEHDVPGLYAWLPQAEGCGIPEFCTLARGMWLDYVPYFAWSASSCCFAVVT